MQLGVTDHVWTIGELVQAALTSVPEEPQGRKVGRFMVIDGTAPQEVRMFIKAWGFDSKMKQYIEADTHWVMIPVMAITSVTPQWLDSPLPKGTAISTGDANYLVPRPASDVMEEIQSKWASFIASGRVS